MKCRFFDLLLFTPKTRFPSPTTNTLSTLTINMSESQPIELDQATDSDLTTLSGQTPTNPGDDPIEIAALIQAQDDVAFDLAYSRLPRQMRIKINYVDYVKYNSIRSSKSQKRAWYWGPDQAEELLRVTKGMCKNNTQAFVLRLTY